MTSLWAILGMVGGGVAGGCLYGYYATQRKISVFDGIFDYILSTYAGCAIGIGLAVIIKMLVA